MRRLKITMSKAALVYAVCFQTAWVQAADIYTGAISLDKTVKLAQQSIPLPDANPQPVLALAMRHGQAKGHFSGKAAELIKQKYGKSIPILVEAVRKEAIKGKPGCNRVQLTFKTTPEFEQTAPKQSVDIEVCPNKSGH